MSMVMAHVYGSLYGEIMQGVWQKGSDLSLISTSILIVKLKL